MAEGVTHISLPTQEYDRGRQEKIERQTNKHEQTWGYQEQREVCNTTCMCIPDSRWYGLTLAWVTSENSTMLLESDILRLFFTGPYLVSSPLCSGVWCWLPLSVLLRPPWSPVATAFCCLPLCSPATNCLSWSPATNFSSLLSNYQLPLSGPCLSLGRVVNSHSPPRTTSGYGEISCPRILCLVSRQNRQLNRLLWQPTPIVLHTSLSYPCHLFSINYNTI